jgi:DnaK suppressor protein
VNTKTPDAHDLVTFRQRLHALADRLSGGVALAEEATRPTGAEALPASELIASEGDEEVARSVLVSEEQLLEEVRAALARFDAGTFGRCVRCGRSVGLARLAALPYARHCIRCACAPDDTTWPVTPPHRSVARSRRVDTSRSAGRGCGG